MKKIILLGLSLLLAVSLFAAPFGLNKGMSLDEITKACNGIEPIPLENDSYYIKPEKNHPLFDYYVVFVDSKIGLYYIKALSSEIKTNDYGNEIKNAFNEIKDRIAKTYGKAKIIDKINSDSLYKEDKWWTSSVRQGARTLAAIWENKQASLPDELSYIGISAKADFGNTGYILLEYQFNNYSQIEDNQDSVF